MSVYTRILCPVDLSNPSRSAIDLATTLAKCSSGRIIFVYVAPQWITDQSIVLTDYVAGTIDADRAALQQIVPSDSSVACEHLFLFGNPGPEIVRVSSGADVIVMNTHGYTGWRRFLMGSVAEYVSRYAACPVITLKCSPKQDTGDAQPQVEFKRRFVTEVMHHAAPVQIADYMENVVAELRSAKSTAAPVINRAGQCVGILTSSDIARFESGNDRGLSVERFYSAPAITIMAHQSCREAQDLLQQHPQIHHLVVVNQQHQPLGILNSHDLAVCE